MGQVVGTLLYIEVGTKVRLAAIVDMLLHATISIDSVRSTRSAHFLVQVIVECLAETEVSQSEHLPLLQQLSLIHI